MISEPFNLVVISFPFIDRRSSRPALVVSSANLNEAHEQSILATVASTMSEWPSDVELRNWRRVGLTPLHDSVSSSSRSPTP